MNHNQAPNRTQTSQFIRRAALDVGDELIAFMDNEQPDRQPECNQPYLDRLSDVAARFKVAASALNHSKIDRELVSLEVSLGHMNSNNAVGIAAKIRGLTELIRDFVADYGDQVENWPGFNLLRPTASSRSRSSPDGSVERPKALPQKHRTETRREDESEKALGARERENLRLVALIGAIQGFEYDPDKRNRASADIETALDSIGLRVSDDTIREHLKEAATQLPCDWRERIRLKK